MRGTLTGQAAREAALALLALRAPYATVCPSEVARALGSATAIDVPPEDWREAMPTVHNAVDQLLSEGLVGLSWKGKAMSAREGPYRIRRGERG